MKISAGSILGTFSNAPRPSRRFEMTSTPSAVAHHCLFRIQSGDTPTLRTIRNRRASKTRSVLAPDRPRWAPRTESPRAWRGRSAASRAMLTGGRPDRVPAGSGPAELAVGEAAAPVTTYTDLSSGNRMVQRRLKDAEPDTMESVPSVASEGSRDSSRADDNSSGDPPQPPPCSTPPSSPNRRVTTQATHQGTRLPSNPFPLSGALPRLSAAFQARLMLPPHPCVARPGADPLPRDYSLSRFLSAALPRCFPPLFTQGQINASPTFTSSCREQTRCRPCAIPHQFLSSFAALPPLPSSPLSRTSA